VDAVVSALARVAEAPDAENDRCMTERPICQGTDQEELLHRYHVDGDLEARRELIERAMPLVVHIARRYINRGEPLDDLIQVGAIGLVKAVDRFDPERKVKLSTFAAPNIAGEIKRHFRDKGWSIRVPRDTQELANKLNDTVDRLTARLSRSPTVAEIATALKVTEEQVLDAMQGARSYSTVSFEQPVGEDRTALDVLGEMDDGFELAEHRVLLRTGIRGLAEREQEIMRLRFVEGLTQAEIAARIGVSQMHVSRLIRKSLEQMHERIADEPSKAARPRGTLRMAAGA
jgi:RNA polymerase sigma-B factor